MNLDLTELAKDKKSIFSIEFKEGSEAFKRIGRTIDGYLVPPDADNKSSESENFFIRPVTKKYKLEFDCVDVKDVQKVG